MAKQKHICLASPDHSSRSHIYSLMDSRAKCRTELLQCKDFYHNRWERGRAILYTVSYIYFVSLYLDKITWINCFVWISSIKIKRPHCNCAHTECIIWEEAWVWVLRVRIRLVNATLSTKSHFNHIHNFHNRLGFSFLITTFISFMIILIILYEWVGIWLSIILFWVCVCAFHTHIFGIYLYFIFIFTLLLYLYCCCTYLTPLRFHFARHCFICHCARINNWLEYLVSSFLICRIQLVLSLHMVDVVIWKHKSS